MTTRKQRIVSLTTIPERILFINPTLEKLCESCADRVVLCLPRKCKKTNSTYNINHLPIDPKLELLRIDEDYGPATKLVPALQKYGNANYYICDDDFVYEPELVNGFFERIKRRTFVCGNGATTHCIVNDWINDHREGKLEMMESPAELIERTTHDHFFFPEVFAGLAFDSGNIDVRLLVNYLALTNETRYSDDLAIGKWFDIHKYKQDCVGYHNIQGLLENQNNYDIPQFSLAGGKNLTGGNRSNYMRAFFDLSGIPRVSTK